MTSDTVVAEPRSSDRTSPARPRRRRRRSTTDATPLGYSLVGPALLIIALIIGFPFVYGVWISATDTTIGSTGQFVGLENYIGMLEDARFRNALKNTVVYVAAAQVTKLVLGLAVATLLMQKFRYRNLFRGMVILPWAVPGFVAFILWRLMYDPSSGLFSIIATALGLGPTNFLGDPDTALGAVVLATVWQGFPFWVMMFLAAMQKIPEELYEAARLDRANGWRQFVHITFPSIRTTVYTVTMLSTIWTTNAFQSVWLTTKGGPAGATETLPVFSYLRLQSLSFGEAAAASLFLVPLLVGFLTLMIMGMRRHAKD